MKNPFIKENIGYFLYSHDFITFHYLGTLGT